MREVKLVHPLQVLIFVLLYRSETVQELSRQRYYEYTIE